MAGVRGERERCGAKAVTRGGGRIHPNIDNIHTNLGLGN